MFNFIKRFIFAWKLARNPDSLKILWTEVKARESDLEINKRAGAMARVAVPTLVPADRHANRKALDVEIMIEHTELLTPEEADQILHEAHIDNKPLMNVEYSPVTHLGNRVAFVKHKEQCLEKLRSENVDEIQ
jgi:hypothetical protein